MTIAEASARWKKNATTVNAYCKQGKIPGAVLVRAKKQCRKQWFIPDDAVCPQVRRQEFPKGAANKVLTGAPMRRADVKDDVDRVWIAQGSKTIGQLARELNVSSARVVELYEMGFKRYLHKGE